ncbi:MAG: TonB-dependent siderophore receptor [Caulobacteraceae bacterium]|nr:TonB-dependent siderophore receptor [Caulobacteraceae bacterium]
MQSGRRSTSLTSTAGAFRRHLLSAGAALALAAASAAGAHAAATTAPGAAADQTQDLETVVVTAPRYVPQETTAATKLATPLLETPQSVTVINRDQIDLLNWQNLGQAVRYTAGVVGENYGSDERYDWLTQRGFYPVQYIDGLQAPVGSVTNTGLDLYGSQSVEILKGPASVLYGLAPPGGIVNMTSRRPEDKFGGSIQALYGSYDDKQIAGDITGAVNPYLSLRLTALYYDRNTQTDGVRSTRTYVAPAATVHFDAHTDLTLLAYYQWDHVSGDGGGFFPAAGIYSYNPVGKITSSMNLGDYGYNKYERRQYGVGYDFKHEFNGDLTFEQNLKYFSNYSSMLDVYGAGYATTTTQSNADPYAYLNPLTGKQETDGSGHPLYTDYRTVNRYNFPFTEAINSFNVDSRLTDHFTTGPVTHTALVGVDFRHYTDTAYYGFSSAPSIDLFNPNHHQSITTPALAYRYLDDIQDQLGVYAQDEAKLDNWILTATVREDWLRQSDPGEKQSPSAFSYRVGLNYVFPIGLSPYISYATSFQPVVGATAAGANFVPTTGDQIEAGVKFEPHFVPRAVKIFTTLAVYDLKQNNVVESAPTLTNPYAEAQTGHVEVKGVEFEAVARIYERLTLNASYSYTESETTGGYHLTITPKNKVSVFADYTFQTGMLAGFGGGVGYRYISSTYGDSANQWLDPGYGLVDAVVHYDFNKWRVAIDASNLFDKTYISQCSSETDCFYGLRRKIVATVTRKF